MPADTGIAFVLLPHLDPDHRSLMVDLLTRQTAIPVCEALDGQSVEANTIYVLPPATTLTISSSKLHVSAVKEPRQTWAAIDHFLRALARDQGARAVGIILSGTGSHGTLGLKEIKLAGGIVVAQGPETARYAQMPCNAIASGLVDLVLPPADMPAALLEYAKHPYLQHPRSEQNLPSEHIDGILAILRTHTQYDFRGYRRNMLARRIQRRMSLRHIDTTGDYHRFLRENSAEVTALYKDLLIGVTAFFREPEAFHVVQQRVIPELVAHSSESNPIRVWVPACATGEEAYSLAMLFLEAFEHAEKSPAMQIFATDIDEEALEVARRGVYPRSIVTDVSAQRLRHFFTALGDDKYQVSKQLRDGLVFAVQNLISDAPFSRLDLISCRNLLIYLQPDLQAKVIQLFHFALKDNGYLLLGPSESIGRQAALFEAASKKWRVFQRIGPTRRDSVNIPINSASLSLPVAGDTAARVYTRPQKAGGFAELTQNTLLSAYAPASVLINRGCEILHFFGPTIDFLQLPSGEPTRNLVNMAREGLAPSIRATVQSALLKDMTVVDGDARLKRDGRYVPCMITARPVHDRNNADELILVSFEEGDTIRALPVEPGAEAVTQASSDEHNIIQQLEHELKAMREDLQSSIEELDSSNEELKASNEEVMSMNEELQSANEELESSKEELQSMNEELNTVNSQLQHQVDELGKSHDDIENLLASSDIATLFLDRDMHIQLFSPPAARLLKLRDGDIGRTISDFSAKAANENLVLEAEQVLDTLIPVEKDVWSGGAREQGRCYLRRIAPYRSSDTRIRGVVITFIDITERHRVEERLEACVSERTSALHEREQRLQAIMNAVVDAIIIISTDGLIQSVNPAATRIFGYAEDELTGRNVNLLLPSQYDDERDLPIVTRYLKTPKKGMGFGRRREFTGCRKDGSSFPLELTITEIDDLDLFAVVVRDLSEKRQLEREVANVSAHEQERIGRDIHDGIGQQLTGLNILAVSLRNDLAASGYEANPTLEDMITNLVSLIGDTRNLSRGLAPVGVGPLGLVGALKALSDQITQTTGVACSFQHNRARIKFQEESAAAQLYRIAQEAANNALKHANATSIAVKLKLRNGVLELAISDDGQGFDLEAARHSTGIGLRIMHYRADLLGGQLDIKTAPGKSTLVRFRIPHLG